MRIDEGIGPVEMDSRLKFVMLLGLMAFSALLFYAVDPGDSHVYPPCPFHALTGFYCPGCGSLRALHQLLHGNIAGAIRLNPLAVAVLPFLGYAFVSYGARTWKKNPAQRRHSPSLWIWLLLVVIIAFWVGRNIPCLHFTVTTPPEMDGPISHHTM